MLNFLCSLTIFASLCTAPAQLGASTFIVQQGGTGSTTLSGILKGNGTSAVGTVVIGSNLSFDGTTLSATGGGGSGNVATSTTETAGQLSYWTSTGATPATLGKVATSSLTINAPLTTSGTPGALVGGTNLTIDIDDIKAADLDLTDITLGDFTNDAGFLTTVDISANTNLGVIYPVVLSNDTLSLAFGTTTSNTWANTQTFTNSPVFTSLTGGLVYSNGTTDTLANVSTTTLAVSGPFTVTGTLGNLVGGSNSTITWNGLATTSAVSQGQLLYNTTGGNGVASVATSSAACSGFISCSGFTVVGSVSPTITTTGQLSIASGGTNNSTFAPNSLLYFNGTSIAATSSQPLYLGSIVSTTTATSTFAGGISTTRLSASATSTVAGLVVQTGGLKVPTLASCDTLDTNAAGDVICGTDASGGGGAFPFTPTTYGGVAVNATTTGLWLQATSPFSLIASSTFFTNASTTRLSVSDNLITQHSAGFLDIRRNGSDFTLARILAPTASPYEATLATVVDCDVPAAGTNERFNDFYAENYSGSRQSGIRFAYSGSCPPVPWVMGFWPTAAQKEPGNQFMLMPNGTSAFAQATSTIDTAARLYIASSTASALLIVDSTPGTELLRITSDGKLGVGTSSPSDQITATVGNNAGIRVSSSNSGFYDVGQGNGDRWRIQNNFNNAGLLEFLYNAGTGNAPSTNLLTLTGVGSGIPGRVGIGSTSPWATLSIVADTQSVPHFAVATSTGLTLFSVSATSTNQGGVQFPSMLAEARVVVGHFINSFYQLFINGRYASSHQNSFCDELNILPVTLSADAQSICGFLVFDEGSTATLAGNGVNASDGSGALATIASGAGSDAVALFAGYFTAAGLGTSTPAMEVVIGPPTTVSSTTDTYVGFTNITGGGASSDPTSGCYFAATSTQTWQAISARSGAAISQTNTGISTSTAFLRVHISMAPSRCAFYYSSTTQNKLSLIADHTNSANIPVAGSYSSNIHLRRTTGGTAIAPNISIYAYRYWKGLIWQRNQF